MLGARPGMRRGSDAQHGKGEVLERPYAGAKQQSSREGRSGQCRAEAHPGQSEQGAIGHAQAQASSQDHARAHGVVQHLVQEPGSDAARGIWRRMAERGVAQQGEATQGQGAHGASGGSPGERGAHVFTRRRRPRTVGSAAGASAEQMIKAPTMIS